MKLWPSRALVQRSSRTAVQHAWSQLKDNEMRKTMACFCVLTWFFSGSGDTGCTDVISKAGRDSSILQPWTGWRTSGKMNKWPKVHLFVILIAEFPLLRSYLCNFWTTLHSEISLFSSFLVRWWFFCPTILSALLELLCSSFAHFALHCFCSLICMIQVLLKVSSSSSGVFSCHCLA